MNMIIIIISVQIEFSQTLQKTIFFLYFFFQLRKKHHLKGWLFFLLKSTLQDIEKFLLDKLLLLKKRSVFVSNLVFYHNVCMSPGTFGAKKMKVPSGLCLFSFISARTHACITAKRQSRKPKHIFFPTKTLDGANSRFCQVWGNKYLRWRRLLYWTKILPTNLSNMQTLFFKK